MSKHFIRTDDNGFIIKTFSSDFEEPVDGDICVNENGGRHYNPDIFRSDGLPRYKYLDGQVVETTDDDLTEQLTRLALQQEMNQLERQLAESDWKAIRQTSSLTHLMEEDEYAAFTAQRDIMRDRIDEIRLILGED